MLDQLGQNARLLVERERHVPRGIITAHPVVIERAQGAEVWDVDGRRYLDFVGGIGVLNVGHNHPRVVHAVRAQLERVTHVSFQVAGYPPYIELAARLNALVGNGEAYKSILLTSGAEAVENAVKIARAYTNRPAVIAFRGGFHGRTLLGVIADRHSQRPTSRISVRLPPTFITRRIPNPYRGCTVEMALAGIEELFATQVAPDRVAAILIEPVQGDGGFLPAPPAFLQALQQIARRHGIVLIVDEIQTGFGRTGTPVRVSAGRHPAGPADHRQEPGRRPAAVRRGRPGRDHGRAAARRAGRHLWRQRRWPAPPHSPCSTPSSRMGCWSAAGSWARRWRTA